MQIFGIGPLELLFILVIMILVLGPKGMIKAARESGKYIRKVTRSPLWAEIVGTSREMRNLPAKIIQDAGIQDEIDELRRSTLPPTFIDNQKYLRQTNRSMTAVARTSRKKKPSEKNKEKKTDQPAIQPLRKKDQAKIKQ
jgi:Sec-independent protein translocase protein TatA